jgi:hypothetical protein
MQLISEGHFFGRPYKTAEQLRALPNPKQKGQKRKADTLGKQQAGKATKNTLKRVKKAEPVAEVQKEAEMSDGELGEVIVEDEPHAGKGAGQESDQVESLETSPVKEEKMESPVREEKGEEWLFNFHDTDAIDMDDIADNAEESTHMSAGEHDI